jgi:hypothetical protein
MKWIGGLLTATTAVLVIAAVLAFSSGSAGAAVVCSGSLPPPESEAVLCLDPDTATNPVGTDHTVTATVVFGSMDLLIGTNIQFTITSDNGIDPVLVRSCDAVQPSPADGFTRCSITYSRSNPGTDSIAATTALEPPVNVTARKTWTDATPTATPTTTATATSTSTATATPTPTAVAPTINTTSNPTGANVAPGSAVTDTATVTGAAGPASGTVTFFLCKPAEVVGAGCAAGTQVGDPVPLDAAGAATSIEATDTIALGTYCWRAVFTSTDPDYASGEHTNTTTECFAVRKFAAQIDTTSQPNGETVAPGAAVSDIAEVTTAETDGPSPTGEVAFYLCGPSQLSGGACLSGGTLVGTATIVGDSATSPESTATLAEGLYCWRAEYRGSTVYNPVTHTDPTDECFTVRRQALSIATQSTPTGSDIIPGTPATDTATLTGAFGAPTGTVTFYLCTPAQVTPGVGCEGGTQIGTAVSLVPGPVTPGGATATASTSTSAPGTLAGGTYCWRAVYSGNGFYAPAEHTNDTTECFTVVSPFLASGAFVIGDLSSGPAGTKVTFWGAQWWKKNKLSAGSAPGNSVASFKGFASGASPLACGGVWTSDPGNSSAPPDGPLPLYMAVIVTDTVQKPGSLITGSIKKILLVKTDPGYGPNPGHSGTGTIHSVVCQ